MIILTIMVTMVITIINPPGSTVALQTFLRGRGTFLFLLRVHGAIVFAAGAALLLFLDFAAGPGARCFCGRGHVPLSSLTGPSPNEKVPATKHHGFLLRPLTTRSFPKPSNRPRLQALDLVPQNSRPKHYLAEALNL